MIQRQSALTDPARWDAEFGITNGEDIVDFLSELTTTAGAFHPALPDLEQRIRPALDAVGWEEATIFPLSIQKLGSALDELEATLPTVLMDSVNELFLLRFDRHVHVALWYHFSILSSNYWRSTSELNSKREMIRYNIRCILDGADVRLPLQVRIATDGIAEENLEALVVSHILTLVLSNRSSEEEFPQAKPFIDLYIAGNIPIGMLRREARNSRPTFLVLVQ